VLQGLQVSILSEVSTLVFFELEQSFIVFLLSCSGEHASLTAWRMAVLEDWAATLGLNNRGKKTAIFPKIHLIHP
jgi:hypothetical protein